MRSINLPQMITIAFVAWLFLRYDLFDPRLNHAVRMALLIGFGLVANQSMILPDVPHD